MATSAKPVCALTGASGYVGSRLAGTLAQDFDVVPLGRKPVAGGIRWAMGQAESVAGALRERGVSVLVHSAWDFSHPKPNENWATNVGGSKRLLEDAKAAGLKRIVFISTISAFEGAESEYGKSKLAVEREVLAAGGTVVRPGLVWGETPGGMFGSMRQQVAKGSMVPTVGDGRYPQYLVHEDDLGETVRALATTSSDEYAGRTLTLANPKPWLLRDLVLRLAAEQGTKVKLVGIPWSLIYGGLKTAEMLGLKLNFRSDSVLSLVRQNANPTFDSVRPVPLRPFV